MRSFIPELRSADLDRVERAVTALVKRKSPEDISPLLRLVIGRNSLAMFNALRVLSVFGEDAEICRFLLHYLNNGSPAVRENAAFALKDLPQRDAALDLKRSAVQDTDEAVRIWSLHALSALSRDFPNDVREVVPIFVRGTKSRSAGVRQAAYECLSLVRDAGFGRIMKRALRDSNPIVRACAPEWIARVASGGKRPRKSPKRRRHRRTPG